MIPESKACRSTHSVREWVCLSDRLSCWLYSLDIPPFPLQRLRVSITPSFQSVYSYLIEAPSWISIPLKAPDSLSPIVEAQNLYYLEILVGSQSVPQPCGLDLAVDNLAISANDCSFCPGHDLFDPSLSSSYQVSLISN